MSFCYSKVSLLACALICTCAMGQERIPESPQRESQRLLKRPADTIATLGYITPEGLYTPGSFAFDTLDFDFHRYDPARRAIYPHATLGNLGSPARSLYFALPLSKGTSIGHHAFDVYKTDFNSFRFYDTDIALSRLEYSQGLSQNDAIIRAQFGRNFDQGINLSVNYQRINQLGSYTMQRAKNTAFGIGVLYRSPKGKLDGIYHYLSNSIVHEDNGGIEDAEIVVDTFNLKENIPVRLVNASTVHRHRELTIQHHLHAFSARQDSLPRKASLDIIHTLSASSAFVKFSDGDILNGESAYYDLFVTDDRGMRNFVSMERLDNAVDLQFRYQPGEPGIPSHLVRAGVQLRNIRLNREPEETTREELFFNAQGRLGISERISLDGNGYFGLLDAAGEYKLHANARLKLFKDAITWGELLLYQRNPNLVESRMFVDQILMWSTDFERVSLSSVQFNYLHPSLRLRLHGAAHVISNYIYYDALRMPVQLDRSVELFQASASKEVSLGPLGILGHLMLQEYDADEIALPTLIFNGQLFYTGRMFRQNLLVRTGIDLLLTNRYHGVSYFPVTGQFYFSDAFIIPQYPAVDLFFSMQVKNVFMAFAKLENITALIRDDTFVQIADYPQFENYFRLGLWMKLSN